MLRPATTLVVCFLFGRAWALELALPTDNLALFANQPERFYMGVDRGGRRVWQGGTFGFVRSELKWAGGTLFTQFHEGIDIAPVHREPGALPSDEVRAVAPGVVVLCETHGRTQYGNQVVLRHDLEDGPLFSRYAHLQAVTVALHDKVSRGKPLGVMGYSGGALTPDRAHLHLEIDLMLHEACDASWLPNSMFGNAQPMFHPANMRGVDAAALFLDLRAKPGLTLAQFVKSRPAGFRVETAGRGPVDLLRRHPWLAADGKQQARGWKVTFTQWGLPIGFEALSEPPPKPRVTWVEPFDGNHALRTGGLLSGTGETAILAAGGEGLLRLIFGGRQP